VIAHLGLGFAGGDTGKADGAAELGIEIIRVGWLFGFGKQQAPSLPHLRARF